MQFIVHQERAAGKSVRVNHLESVVTPPVSGALYDDDPTLVAQTAAVRISLARAIAIRLVRTVRRASLDAYGNAKEKGGHCHANSPHASSPRT